MVRYYLLICSVYGFLWINALDDFPVRKINQGNVQGIYMTSTNGKKFSGFLGIPYAKPPVGELRFEPPQPAESWDNVFEATLPHAICPQIQVFSTNPKGTGSEDCLYLNVFTPQKNIEEKKLYPVMVFIHGGGFLMGSGQLYGPDILLDYDVVYVNLNYRLGALGFLTTGDNLVPGNNGLKDQVLALKWINDNIKHFGGDPKKITLFGQSAGGASVHYHQFSPLSKGLFQYAISQSGTVFNHWAMDDRAVVAGKGKQLARALNCTTENNREMVECLRTIHPHKFIETDKIFMKWEFEPILPFKPVVEVDHKGAFLSEHPIDILKAGKHNQVPWITGFTTEEGVLKLSSFLKNPQFFSELDEDFNRIMSIIFESKNINFDELRQFYFQDKTIGNTTQFQLVDMFSDFMFSYAAKKAALLHLKYSNEPVYFYLFGHKTPYSFSEMFGDESETYGTCHSDETILQFNFISMFKNVKKRSLDEESAKLLNTLWTNFAKTGNPTPETNLLVQTKWEPVTTEELECCFIERNIYATKNILPHRMNFWEKFEASTHNKKIVDEL